MSACDWSASGYLSIDGVRLEYACLGPRPDERPTLVLLHEGLGSIALWRDFPAELQAATGLGVFLYTRQGYGRSTPVILPRPFDYHLKEAVDVLPKVLDAIGVTRGMLVGHSDGATIAALHAAHFPDSGIAGITLMAPHFFVEDIAVEGVKRALAAYEGGPLRARLARYHDDVDGAFHGWNDTWRNPDFRGWSIETDLDRIVTPVLAIQGRGDEYGTLKQFDPLRERLRGAYRERILDDCGHIPFMDKPDETIAAIADFARSNGLITAH
jgi:pimeloyl-ACP methyl ester carboxylesterase